jgi:hypothetical protein
MDKITKKNYSLYKKHNISKITILTVGNSYKFDIDKITFEALPYREWAIIDKESNI